MRDILNYTESIGEELIKHCEQGRSIVSFRGKKRITQTLFAEWVRDHKEFADAVNIASDCCTGYWENEMISSYKEEAGSFNDDKGLLTVKDRNTMAYNMLKQHDTQHFKTHGASPFVMSSSENDADPTAFGSANVDECVREFDNKE